MPENTESARLAGNDLLLAQTEAWARELDADAISHPSQVGRELAERRASTLRALVHLTAAQGSEDTKRLDFLLAQVAAYYPEGVYCFDRTELDKRMSDDDAARSPAARREPPPQDAVTDAPSDAELLREVAVSGVESNDFRKYVLVQIDRDTWENIRTRSGQPDSSERKNA